MISGHQDRTSPDTPTEPSAALARTTAPSRDLRRGRYARAGIAAGVVIVVLVAAYVALVGAPAAGAAALPVGSGLTTAGAIGPGCNPSAERYATPTALMIPNYNPSTSVVVGDHVNITYEFKVSAETIRPNAVGINVYSPTVFTTMPTVGGSSFPVTFNNHTATIPGPQWVPWSFDKLVTSNFTFNPKENASLSTQKVGTMADTPYGTLKLEWRWSWNITFLNGSYLQGPWTVPSLASKHDVSLPSIFKPAPYVALEQESPINDLIGSNYTMYLGGDVAGRAFYIEFESESGVLQAATWVYDNATTNATFEANITMLGFDNELTPGLYLVHIHDSCGAMLYSKRVTLSYASNATIQIYTTPSTCGSITLNGTVYTNGESAVLTPSGSIYNFSFHACNGYTFSNWTREGGIHIQAAGEMIVSSSGTFIANFRPT